MLLCYYIRKSKLTTTTTTTTTTTKKIQIHNLKKTHTHKKQQHKKHAYI